MNQELRHQECAQAMHQMIPTSFRQTRRVQQPKPLSRSPLSNNLYGRIAFWERKNSWERNTFVFV